MDHSSSKGLFEWGIKKNRLYLFYGITRDKDTFLLFYLWGTLLYAGKYHPWIEKQISLINKSNDENLTQKELKTLVHEREKQYVEALNAILLCQPRC